MRVRPDGHVTAVAVLQRLVVGGRGDYSFAVPAPVDDVTAAAGSASEPGLREGAVLWQGFSAGGRLLAANLRLEPAAAAAALPLRLELARSGPRRLRLSIVNETTTRIATFDAEAVPASLAAALDATRADLRAGRLPRARRFVIRPPIRRRDAVVGVPLRVRVAIDPPAGVRIVARSASGLAAAATRGVIPAGSRALVELTLSEVTDRVPDVRVTAVPVAPLDRLEPRGARSWEELLARDGSLVDPRRLLRGSIDTLLGLARARQYDRFVANPDAAGGSRATYVFRLAEQAAAPTAGAPANQGGGSHAVTIVILVVLLGALAGGVVAWAHA